MFLDPLLMEAEDMKWRLFREEGQIYENQERPIVSNHQNEEQQREEDVSEDEEREHMFEKPLTPSDVGKLNRLVIPKQHAEKFFPLDSTNNEKDLLLSFEDSMGKDWRFRYSYWNSSQSYVLTKGWSRFVKEKKLDAGDVVSFERRVSGKRLYISWKRRQISEVPPTPALWNRLWYSCNPNPSDPIFYLRPPSADIYPGEPIGDPITPARSKRLRLFGVNLDCSTEPSEPDRSNGRIQSGSELRPTEGSSSSSSPTDFDH